MVAPSARAVDMPIDGGFVGMVDREAFDEWLRERAAAAGAVRRTGQFVELTRDDDGVALVHFRRSGKAAASSDQRPPMQSVRARVVIGADGAKSVVAAQCIPGANRIPYVFAYHEIVRSPAASFDGERCDVYYQGACRRTSMAGCFRTAPLPVSAAVPPARGFPCAGRSGPCARQPGWRRRRPYGVRARLFPLRPLRRWDNGQRRGAGGRRRRRGRPSLGRGHLLRDGRRPAGRRGGCCVPCHRRRRGTPLGPAALHAGAWLGVPDPAHDAVVLVFERQAAGTLRQHLPRPRRATPDLGIPT